MAKSARAGSTKAKRAHMRAKVFGPADDARLERLSARLLEHASLPKPERPQKMDVDETTNSNEKKDKMDVDKGVVNEDGMDVDQDPSDTKSKSKGSKKHPKFRVGKNRRGKPTSSVTFKVVRRGKVIDPGRRIKRTK